MVFCNHIQSIYIKLLNPKIFKIKKSRSGLYSIGFVRKKSFPEGMILFSSNAVTIQSLLDIINQKLGM